MMVATNAHCELMGGAIDWASFVDELANVAESLNSVERLIFDKRINVPSKDASKQHDVAVELCTSVDVVANLEKQIRNNPRGQLSPAINRLVCHRKSWDIDAAREAYEHKHALAMQSAGATMPGFVSIARLDIAQVFSLIDDPGYVVIDGTNINLRTRTNRCFKQKGVTCVTCGIRGEFFSIERHINDNGTELLNLMNGTDTTESNMRYSARLYATNAFGRKILMTKDHILPRAHGGRDAMSNLQPMCSTCNRKKGRSSNV